MDSVLLVFKRQYLQCFEPDFLLWPPPALLKETDAQRWIYTNCFDDTRSARLPPDRYQARVLKALVARIEKAIDDPDEDVCRLVLNSEADTEYSNDPKTFFR